jgi:hypothetical protein
MTISVLTCDDHVDQIIRVATENGSPQDVQFRDPTTFLSGIAASGTATNTNVIEGELEITWVNSAPITPVSSAKYLVWCTFPYSCDSTSNNFTISLQPLTADEIVVSTSHRNYSATQREVTLFGIVQSTTDPFLWRITCTSDSGTMSIPSEQISILWVELSGPYVAPLPPPP